MEDQGIVTEKTVVTELSVKEAKAQIFKERMAKARAGIGKKAKEKEEAKPIVTKTTDNSPGVIWFGEIDINKHGKPSSDYPAWYFDVQIKELRREIDDIERGLDNEAFQGKDKLKMKTLLAQRKERYEKIMESKPKLRDVDKDRIAKSRKELGERIGESQYCYTDMQKGAMGNADPQVEADRMVNPCIEVKNTIEADFCKQAGIRISNGKISRNDAVRIWQIQGKLLQEGILSAEVLRSQK